MCLCSYSTILKKQKRPTKNKSSNKSLIWPIECALSNLDWLNVNCRVKKWDEIMDRHRKWRATYRIICPLPKDDAPLKLDAIEEERCSPPTSSSNVSNTALSGSKWASNWRLTILNSGRRASSPPLTSLMNATRTMMMMVVMMMMMLWPKALGLLNKFFYGYKI